MDNKTNNIMEYNNTNKPEPPKEVMTRKEALLKAGKYAAFTAAAMLLVLDPVKSQVIKSIPDDPRASAPLRMNNPENLQSKSAKKGK